MCSGVVALEEDRFFSFGYFLNLNLAAMLPNPAFVLKRKVHYKQCHIPTEQTEIFFISLVLWKLHLHLFNFIVLICKVSTDL